MLMEIMSLQVRDRGEDSFYIFLATVKEKIILDTC